MNTFQKVLDIPGAATVMASKISGRVIDQIARGFGEDPVLSDELNLFKAIQEKYPDPKSGTYPLPNMFKDMVRKAKDTVDADLDVAIEGLSPEQQALWTADGVVSEKQALLNIMPQLTAMLNEAVPNAESWDDLPTIAQWSLLNSTEAALPTKVALYKSWADRDRLSGKVNTNAMQLEKTASEAIPKLFDVVTEFLEDDDVKEDLALEIEKGTNVPPRLIAQAA